MLRPNLHNLPPLELPEGYVLRHFRQGDETQLSEVFEDAFDSPGMDFSKMVKRSPGFMPQRSWLVAHGEHIVASTSFLMEPDCPAARFAGVGFVHWVSVRKAHAGKRLGYWASVGVLRRMVSEGFRAAGLGTDDARFPAIKTYLNLGFQPRLVHDSHRDRWRKIFANLAAPELSERFADILAGPLYEF